MTLSHKYEKKGNTIINPTYRIRLNFDKPKVNSFLAPKVNSEQLIQYKSIIKSFFEELKKQDFDKAKSYLSERIINTITSEQLIKLRENIKFDDDLELFMHGFQTGADGSVFMLLQYKYTSDQNSPPKEMIKILMDDKNKILGIQPLKRM